MNFHVGQKVVALIDHKCPLFEIIKGKIYTIHSIKNCCKQNLNIGLGHPKQRTFNKCCRCNSIISITDNYFYLDHKGFAPLPEKREHNKANITIKIHQPTEETIDTPIPERIE